MKKGFNSYNAGENNGMFGRRGEETPRWKGDNVSYGALHLWVRKYLPKPRVCRDCNQPKRLDLANISQEYKRDLNDWEYLCRKCHMTKDGRLAKFITQPRKRKS